MGPIRESAIIRKSAFPKSIVQVIYLCQTNWKMNITRLQKKIKVGLFLIFWFARGADVISIK